MEPQMRNDSEPMVTLIGSLRELNDFAKILS